MNRWLRKLLSENGRFRWAVSLLAAVILAATAVIVSLVIQSQKALDQRVRDIIKSEGGRIILALSDEANAPFLPYVDALNALDGPLDDPRVRRTRLDSLARLPHVIAALCLVQGERVEASSSQDTWTDLVDSLRALRGEFFGVRREILGSMLGRARFHVYSHRAGNACLIADTYDSAGRRIVRVKGGHKYQPDETAYLFAVVLDPSWIRQAIRDHMNRVIFEKDRFLLNTFEETDGLGVLMGADTVWWFGLRQPNKKSKFSYINDWDWSSNDWFRFRTVSEVPPDEQLADAPQGWIGRLAWLLKFSPFAVCFLLLASGGIFILTIVQMRRQWLSRQIALEQLTHSIKTPVARLKLNSDTLVQRRVASPEIESDLLQAIGRECSQLDRAVQNAAIVIRDGGLSVYPATFDLRDLLEELRLAWMPAFQTRQVELAAVCEGDSAGTFDRGLLTVLFDNLLDNALRHSRASGASGPLRAAWVAVRLSPEGHCIRIDVRNSGPGIDPKDLRRIFNRFERGRNLALSDAAGLGLGLFIAKEIVQAHGGTIEASNISEGGACFTVRLPRHIRKASIESLPEVDGHAAPAHR